jgi:valyl-tRNA synthetase
VHKDQKISFDEPKKLNAEDKKILKELENLIIKTNKHIDSYKLNNAISGIYKFLWNKFAK